MENEVFSQHSYAEEKALLPDCSVLDGAGVKEENVTSQSGVADRKNRCTNWNALILDQRTAVLSSHVPVSSLVWTPHLDAKLLMCFRWELP